MAVACPKGHWNPIHSTQCMWCGAPVESQELHDILPPGLGWLRFQDGSVVELNRAITLGRVMLAERDRYNLGTASDERSSWASVSRQHARIEIDGWHVLVTDLNSTNGTFVTLPGAPTWRIPAGDPFLLEDHAIISLGGQVEIRYEVLKP